MKALYLIFHGFEAYNGISKKIHYQVDALKACGIDTRLCYINIDAEGNQKRMIDNQAIESFERNITGKIKKWIDYSAIIKYIDANKIDLVYIRSYHNANPYLISFLKLLKEPNIKAILEIPTYPYDNEYGEAPLSRKLQLCVDKIFRKKMAKQLFRIVTFTDNELIFNAPTIRISNGIDFNAIAIKKSTTRNNNTIKLLGVAEIHTWHGFDRVIKGLSDYYYSPISNRPIVTFDIVGYGDRKTIDSLKQMIESYNLSEYVQYLGPKYGDELDACFNSADIGIASLGRHRSGIVKIKTLKNREYAARGIPFVYSETDDDFDKMPYVLKAPSDDSPIDISALITFYRNLEMTTQQIRESVTHLSWVNQMKIVIDECTK